MITYDNLELKRLNPTFGLEKTIKKVCSRVVENLKKHRIDDISFLRKSMWFQRMQMTPHQNWTRLLSFWLIKRLGQRGHKRNEVSREYLWFAHIQPECFRLKVPGAEMALTNSCCGFAASAPFYLECSIQVFTVSSNYLSGNPTMELLSPLSGRLDQIPALQKQHLPSAWTWISMPWPRNWSGGSPMP